MTCWDTTCIVVYCIEEVQHFITMNTKWNSRRKQMHSLMICSMEIVSYEWSESNQPNIRQNIKSFEFTWDSVTLQHLWMCVLLMHYLTSKIIVCLCMHFILNILLLCHRFILLIHSLFYYCNDHFPLHCCSVKKQNHSNKCVKK